MTQLIPVAPAPRSKPLPVIAELSRDTELEADLKSAIIDVLGYIIRPSFSRILFIAILSAFREPGTLALCAFKRAFPIEYRMVEFWMQTGQITETPDGPENLSYIVNSDLRWRDQQPAYVLREIEFEEITEGMEAI